MKEKIKVIRKKGFYHSYAKIEKDILLHAVAFHFHNVTLTAKALKIGRSTLYRKLEDCGYIRPKTLLNDEIKNDGYID